MNTKERFVITVNRELGSGGRTVGEKLCERLGVRYYDKAVIDGLISHFNTTAEEIEREKGRRHNWWTEFCDAIVPAPAIDYYEYTGHTSDDELYRVETEIVREIAGEESCVIAGRSGHFILRDHPNKLSVFIRASLDERVARIMQKQELSEAEARAVIEKVDKGRENYTVRHTGLSRYDLRNYDLVLNMDGISEDEAAEIILRYISSGAK